MHARKLIRIIESADTKLLVAIAKVETDDKLKSDFEEIAAYILPCDPVANKKLTQIRMGNTVYLMLVLNQ